MNDLGQGDAAASLRQLLDAADLAGAVRLVFLKLDALLPSGAEDRHRGLDAAHALLAACDSRHTASKAP